MNAKTKAVEAKAVADEMAVIANTHKVLGALRMPSVEGGGLKANHWTTKVIGLIEENSIAIFCDGNVEIQINNGHYTVPVAVLVASFLELYPSLTALQTYCSHAAKGYPTLLQYKVSLAESKLSVHTGRELEPWQRLALELKQSGIFEEITTQSNIETIFAVVSKENLTQFEAIMAKHTETFKYREVKDFHTKGKYKNNPDKLGYYIQAN